MHCRFLLQPLYFLESTVIYEYGTCRGKIGIFLILITNIYKRNIILLDTRLTHNLWDTNFLFDLTFRIIYFLFSFLSSNKFVFFYFFCNHNSVLNHCGYDPDSSYLCSSELGLFLVFWWYASNFNVIVGDPRRGCDYKINK